MIILLHTFQSSSNFTQHMKTNCHGNTSFTKRTNLVGNPSIRTPRSLNHPEATVSLNSCGQKVLQMNLHGFVFKQSHGTLEFPINIKHDWSPKPGHQFTEDLHMKFIRSDIKSPVPFAKRQTLSKNWMPRLRREQRSTHTEREEHARTGHICGYVHIEREGGGRGFTCCGRERRRIS